MSWFKCFGLPFSLLLSAMLFLSACGGDGGDIDRGTGGTGGTGPDGGTNQQPIAVTGPDQDTSRLFVVTLDGSESSDPDGDTLTYTWTQTEGPDATDGAGTLSGASPTFEAPGEVGTLVFELVVNDGEVDSAPATVVVNVFENQNVAYFVDGDAGSDETGTGSRDNPFASIAKALCEVTDDQQDIYVATLAGGARYQETIDPCPDVSRDLSSILMVPTGTSLYGGYDGQWHRGSEPDLVDPGDSHISDPTGIDTSHHGIRFEAVDIDAWLSGFDLQTDDSPTPGESVAGVSADNGGAASLHVTDNTIAAGNVAPGTALNPGSSYGVRIALSDGDSSAYIERNLISSGFGGDGSDRGNTFAQAAAAGGDAAGTSGGSGVYAGGGGGAPGTSGGENGSTGGRGQGPGAGNTGGLGGCGGGAGSSSSCNGGGSDSGAGQNGYTGASGAGGPGGAAGPGGNGDGDGDRNGDGDGDVNISGGNFLPGAGRSGGSAGAGRGGGGGGGGEANTGVNGGRGGGAGGGGSGGRGGPGGPGGGASIGILIAGVTTSVIADNQIDSGFGGLGAQGGIGQLGGDGGSGSNGNPGNSGAFGIDGGNGGRGGPGGPGGVGGGGGGGGGGPSFGVLVGPGIAPAITGNDIDSGPGGDGGDGADSGSNSNGTSGDGGNGGYSYALYDADVNDEFVPAASGNTLSFGLAGNAGNAGLGTPVGSAGDPGQANVRNW